MAKPRPVSFHPPLSGLSTCERICKCDCTVSRCNGGWTVLCACVRESAVGQHKGECMLSELAIFSSRLEPVESKYRQINAYATMLYKHRLSVKR